MLRIPFQQRREKEDLLFSFSLFRFYPVAVAYMHNACFKIFIKDTVWLE